MSNTYHQVYDQVRDVYNVAGNFNINGMSREEFLAMFQAVFQQPPPDPLLDALLALDYYAQEDIFLQCLAKSRVGVFLIHGDGDEYGHDWLLNRLLQHLRARRTKAKVVKINLGSYAAASDIDSLWSEVGNQINFALESPSWQQIAQEIFASWQNHDIIFNFYQVNNTYPEWMQEFINDFWLRLSDLLPTPDKQPVEHWLMLFLTSYTSSINAWESTITDFDDQQWSVRKPVKLPVLDRFTADILKEWVRNNRPRLPSALTIASPQLPQEIVNKSNNGIPQRAMIYICKQSECNWYDKYSGVTKWLK